MKKHLFFLLFISFITLTGFANIQYASEVIDFSSQYTESSWSAQQLLGAPDTYPDYGDIMTAWASQSADGSREYLVLGYSSPMQVSHIGIFETYNPGAVDTIYVRNASNGQWNMVWSGTAIAQSAESRIFQVEFTLTNYLVDAVRIAVNSPAIPGWNEIDAVAIADEAILGGGGGGTEPQPLTLLAHYPLTGDANDVSGNDFHGQIIGNVTPTEGPSGETAGAMYFDGNQSYIEISNNQTLANPGNSMTITYWVNVDAFFGNLWASVVCKSDFAEAQYRLGHGRNSAYFAYNGTLAFNAINYPFSIEDGWTFVAASYDGDSVRFYRNTDKLYTMPLVPSNNFLNTDDNLYIGYDPALSDDWLTGSVFDVRIYSGSMTDEQVIAVYEGAEPSAIGEESVINKIKVYPNPVSEYIRFDNSQFTTGDALIYQLINLQGQLVKVGRFDSSNNKIPVNTLGSGLYLLRIINGNKIYQSKLIKR